MAKSARILHVVSSLEPGGLENGVVNIISRSQGSGLEHGVLCLERAGAFAERLPAGVPVHVVHKRPGNDPVALARTFRAAHAFGADLVHTRNWSSLVEGAFAALATGARHVHGLHGRTEAELAGIGTRRRVVERFLCRRADRVYALLPALEGELEELGVPAHKRAILENGVELERFRPDPEARARLRQALGASPGEVLVGCVARLDPVKDHATLLRAFTKLPPRVRLVLAGDGPLRRSLEQLAKVEGILSRVRFLGHVSEPVFPALDVFVLPSLYEGFSNTILEAMACGVPVVATSVGGTPSLVAPDRGVLVPPGDPQALGAALVRLANEEKKRRALGQGGLAFARTRSLDRMARAYEELYRTVLEPAPVASPVPA